VNVHLKVLSPEAFFSPKCTKYRLAAGLCPDPLGCLQRSPRPPSFIKGYLLLREGRGGKGWGEGKGREEGVGRERGNMRHWL